MTLSGGDPRDATAADAGRSCPYCRFALKTGAPIVDCASCKSAHHADCWEDNGGCAVMGCAGAPTVGSPAPAAAPAPPPATASVAGPAPVPPAPRRPAAAAATPPAPPAGGSRSSTVLALAILVLALAIGGAAVAFVLTREDGGGGGSPGTSQAAQGSAPSPPSTPDVDGDTTSTEPETPAAAEVRASEIHDVVLSYYGAVRNGDYERAWSLLSPSYKRWKSAGNGGRTQWERQERRNQARLRVGDPAVEVQSFDAPSSVATIYVSGMRFMRDDGTSCPYEGITWMRRVDGDWLYDQGYRQNSARATKWRPRRTETLGYNCESSY